MDFSTTLIHCSSLSCLFTEPLLKVDKEAGNLSKTAKTHLVEVYAKALWGFEKDIVTKQMRKGTDAEEHGISILSMLHNRMYYKNDERKTNGYISGHADIVTEDEIIDIKLSWDAFTFLPKLIEDMDKCYYYQLQGYLWLWDRECGRICHCLVNTPDNIIQGEKYRLLRSMDVVSEESPEFIAAATKLENNMRFDQIPIEQRVITHFAYRDNDVISKIPAKIEKARQFLSELYEIHNKVINLAV